MTLGHRPIRIRPTGMMGNKFYLESEICSRNIFKLFNKEGVTCNDSQSNIKEFLTFLLQIQVLSVRGLHNCTYIHYIFTEIRNIKIFFQDTTDIPIDTGGNKWKLQLIRCDLDNCHPTTTCKRNLNCQQMKNVFKIQW